MAMILVVVFIAIYVNLLIHQDTLCDYLKKIWQLLFILIFVYRGDNWTFILFFKHEILGQISFLMQQVYPNQCSFDVVVINVIMVLF